ncbi:MAG: response regulator [Hyphomonadaceae bacterium]|nr:response regulator [Hyphomonadaceae bacterium]
MTQPSAKTRLLVVDDDEQVRTLLRHRFEQEGFIVGEAAGGADLKAALLSEAYDLITLDLNLDGEDGLALAREIRAERNIPIIMISGKNEEVDRVVGLEVGADDYITKPFSPREVVARVRAVLRRYAGPASAPAAAPVNTTPTTKLVFEGGLLDLGKRELRSPAGAPIGVTTAEFNLMELFLRHPQRVLSRDEIMTALKGIDWTPFDRSVDTAIGRLRKKIEPDPAAPTYIKTVRGVGYVFSGEVRPG